MKGFHFSSNYERTKFLIFAKKHLRYLPGDTPESIVWSAEAAEKILCAPLPDAIASEPDFKARLASVAAARPGLTADTVFQWLVSDFLSRDSPELKKLIEIVNEIRA